MIKPDWRLWIGIIMMILFVFSFYLAKATFPVIGMLPYVGLISTYAILLVGGIFFIFWNVTNKIKWSLIVSIGLMAVMIFTGITVFPGVI